MLLTMWNTRVFFVFQKGFETPHGLWRKRVTNENETIGDDDDDDDDDDEDDDNGGNDNDEDDYDDHDGDCF